ncbi:MAG: DEAD/DEAH box helicase [Prolixibacteraceae bacterium]|jgi:ATP-dependent RNA helicase RhlE|nr:DEAD/DEAH box helicase [Prolixibacteraceae bacterium]
MTFKELELISPILRAVEAKGYTVPTPIQEQSIPILLQGKDLLGCAQTGTGKTAAFAIPILQHLYNKIDVRKGKRKINALVLTPTRELAIQIYDSFNDYGKFTGLKSTVIFGGVKQHTQVNTLRNGVDILVATPGRLLDLINQGYISLSDVEYFVLDEADHMLDMGFIHDIKRVIGKLPKSRQSLFFSATMPFEIVQLAGKILGKPEKVTINPEQATAERVEQKAYYVTKSSKPKLLVHLLQEKEYESTLVFSRTKYGADKIVKVLNKAGINSEAIHGNKSQGARQNALGKFKEGKLKVLVATDIAARGIDVSALALVINYDLPNISETYVHRIGRTGRAEASGLSISFCDREERVYLRDIQKLIGQKIPIQEVHPFVGDVDEIKPRKSVGNTPRKKRPNTSSNKPKSAGEGSSRGKRKPFSGNKSSGGGSDFRRNKSSNTRSKRR